MGGPYGLDFNAVLAVANGMGAVTPLLFDVLPAIEPVILKAYETEEEGEG